jgi:GT2 family glycosyltransferase
MNTASPLVSVCIVTFNSGAHIARCLQHLARQTHAAIEIIVVDNDSRDGSLADLRRIATAGRITLIETGTNTGFAKGTNLAFQRARGEFLLALNADAFLAPDYIARCVSAFRRDPSIGTVVGKLLAAHDARIIDSAGVVLFREGLAVERGIGRYDRGQYDREEFLFGACAAAAMYRRAMLDSIAFDGAYFDEVFFAYAEDVDLCARAALAGWKTLYLPAAIAAHVRGGSTAGSAAARYLAYRNLLYLQEGTLPSPNAGARVGRALLAWIRMLTIPRDSRLRARRELRDAKAYLARKRNAVEATRRGDQLDRVTSGSYLSYALLQRLRRGRS